MTNTILQKGIKGLILICLILFIPNLQAQLTITVTSIPSTTPQGENIFIAGNFNNWNPGNSSYQLTDNHDGTWSIKFTPSPGALEYKFTRGSWATVEGTSEGGFRPNRTYTYAGGVQSTAVSIAGWEGISGDPHTATSNVQILDENYYIPQLDRHRRIWLYLPTDYLTSTKRYPVLYMQDGQNLFDTYYSFAGEWKVDESMNELFDNADYSAIVVGIDNGGANRTDEYCPYVNPSYGGGHGEAYASFIVHTLKPHIDSLFRTRPEREYTGIAGSSLGANISMFAAVEYQDVFSKVGIFSPAFWISDSINQHITHTGIHQEMKIYFVAGTNESSTMISDMQAVYDTLASAGENVTNMNFISSPDGAHSEWFWAREYPAAYDWLFGDLVLNTTRPKEKKGNVFPNPASQFLWINTDESNVHVTIYSVLGEIMKNENTDHDNIDISNLSSGIYILEIKSLSCPDLWVTRFVKQ
ncbi:MAG: T9SS type A sorting domain-containing protein [Saprospiraceae bacterium]|uniref:T9SS type A sorting domain-containing protein n=1 Tax=Candidatus Opimibacter skivensis TaxID=2982028 RepID=A0A9D7XNP7_9BACT|nr:T9SS type A sorting domain-containing protein [Candidatus Opimibacter skivensis]